MKKIKSLLILIVLFTIFVASVNAQALDNWVFGGNARINTISTSPTAATSMVNTLEGSSSISDSNGNLLFYTDGTNVWNRTNAIMPSVIPATGKLMGSSSSTTSSLIVPCDCNKYFIFTTDSTEHQYQNGLRYSVVDMNAPSGSGNGDVTSANNLLLPRSSEKIAAVAAPPSAGGGFWVVAHEIGTNRFFSYRIQANGNCTINPQSELNRISSVGKVFLGGGGNPSANFGQGEMKISPDGGKIAVAGTGWGNGSFIEVFRFNTTTGAVTNISSATHGDYETPTNPQTFYGVEFSPDSRQLYVSTFQSNNRIYQYDVAALTPAIFVSSRETVADIGQVGGPTNGYGFGQLELSPSGGSQPQKIYIARNSNSFLSVINNPNNPTASLTGFVANGQTLASGSQSSLGLPAMVSGSFTCGTKQENCCDQMKVTPFLYPDLSQSGRTFEIYNIKYPVTDICSIDINFNPTPIPGNWTGGNLSILQTIGGSLIPTPWTYPFKRIPTPVNTNLNPTAKPSSAASPSVKFNLGTDITVPYNGEVQLTVNHCDNSVCKLSYKPWIVNPQGTGGGNPTGVLPWRFNVRDLSAELAEVTLTYEGGRERIRLPEGGKGAKWLGLVLKDEGKELYSIDGNESARKGSKKFGLSSSSITNNTALFEFNGLLNLANRELNGRTITFLVRKKSDKKIEPKEIVLMLFDENSNEIIVGNPR